MNNGDGVYVKFEGSEKEWGFNPAVLERLSLYSIGQVVRINEDQHVSNS